MSAPSSGRPLLSCAEPRPGSVVVQGEVDMSTAGKLASMLASSCLRDRDVEVDLTGVSFIDSAGVHALLGALEHLDPACRLIVTVQADSAVYRALELLGIERVPRVEVRTAA